MLEWGICCRQRPNVEFSNGEGKWSQEWSPEQQQHTIWNTLSTQGRAMICKYLPLEESLTCFRVLLSFVSSNIRSNLLHTEMASSCRQTSHRSSWTKGFRYPILIRPAKARKSHPFSPHFSKDMAKSIPKDSSRFKLDPFLKWQCWFFSVQEEHVFDMYSLTNSRSEHMKLEATYLSRSCKGM